jgi:cupin fold WbuC family metalloprotein
VLPLHAAPDDSLQRMLNALQPDSYVQPHRHDGMKAESVIVLRGRVGFVTFDDGGDVTASVAAAPGTDCIGLDVRPRVYHTFFALVPDTVVFEVKAGPYDPQRAKEFAPWAPGEDDPAAPDYLAELHTLFP